MLLFTKLLLFFAYSAPLIFFSEARGQSGFWMSLSSNGFTPRKELSSSIVNGKIYAIGGGFMILLKYMIRKLIHGSLHKQRVYSRHTMDIPPL